MPQGSQEQAKAKEALNTYKAMDSGMLTLKAHPSFILYDSYENVIQPHQGKYKIPLNYKGYYMRTDGRQGSFAQLQRALKNAHIEGYEPLDIIAKDIDSSCFGVPCNGSYFN